MLTTASVVHIHGFFILFISANALFPSSSHSGVLYLSHKLLVKSSLVSFGHSVCQLHSMNYVNSNLAELLLLSCAYCQPSLAWLDGRGDGRNYEI